MKRKKKARKQEHQLIHKAAYRMLPRLRLPENLTGRQVKISFDTDANAPVPRECMWVTVIIDSGPLAGVLDNDPVYCRDLRYGDQVGFCRRQILDIAGPEGHDQLGRTKPVDTEEQDRRCGEARHWHLMGWIANYLGRDDESEDIPDWPEIVDGIIEDHGEELYEACAHAVDCVMVKNSKPNDGEINFSTN
jgi:hypothetical protein